MPMWRSPFTFLLTAVASCSPSQTPEPADLIAEARTLPATVGEEIWPGLADGPFRVLLIDEETERLYCTEDGVPDGFEPAGRDDATNCEAFERPRQFDPNLLAAFPLDDGVPTIVVGTPEATGKNAEEWIVTLLHELVHVRQYASPNYDERTRALGLADGDETGMWMLNYPFPYDDAETGEAFASLARAAADGLEARGTDRFGGALRTYLAARDGFASSVSPSDLRYYDLQAWQEGTARYVERRVGAAWDDHPATDESVAAELGEELRSVSLAEDQRVAFYPLGAAEAFLLDTAEPGWERYYFDGPLSLGMRLEGATHAGLRPLVRWVGN